MQPKTIPFGQEQNKPKTIPFGSTLTPPQQTTLNALNETPVLGQISNMAIGVGSAVGKTVAGAPEAMSRILGKASNLVGMNNLGASFIQNADKIAQFKNQIFEKPFEKSLNTTSGQVGQVIGNVAPFFLTAPAQVATKAPALTRFIASAPSALADVGTTLAQTGGNMGAGLATGVTSAVANTILPGSGGFISRTAKGSIPGYIGDVSMGLAGQRGEERKGAQAFIPGAGTLLGSAFSGATNVRNPLLKQSAEQKTIAKRMNVFNTLEKENRKVAEAFRSASSKNVNVKDILSKTNLLNGAVDTNGTISTTKALENFKDFISPYESRVRDTVAKEGAKVNLKQLSKIYAQGIKNSSLQGDARVALLNSAKRDLKGFQMVADKEGNIPLTALHDSKVFKMSKTNYLDPAAEEIKKENARILKKAVEDNTKSLDVKKYNEELSQLYAVRSALIALDKKKVEGGRLGKHFATVVGGVVGGHFGPLGAIAGAEAGSLGKGLLMQRALGGEMSGGLKPGELMSKNQLKSLGSLNMSQAPTRIDTSMNPIVLRKAPQKKPVVPISDTTRMLPAPQKPVKPIIAGGKDAFGNPINALGERIPAGSGESYVKSVKAKKNPVTVNPKTNKFQTSYNSEAGFAKNKTLAGAGVGSLAGWEKDDKGNWKYNPVKGLGGALIGGAVANKKVGLRLEDISVTPEQVAKKMDNTDIKIIKQFLEKPKDINTFMKAQPILEGMKINQAPAPVQQRFLKEALDLADQRINPLRAKARVASADTALLQEAKKYKTAEEFVKAQTIKLLKNEWTPYKNMQDQGAKPVTTFDRVKDSFNKDILDELKKSVSKEPVLLYRFSKKGVPDGPISSWSKDREWASDMSELPGYELRSIVAQPEDIIADIERIDPSLTDIGEVLVRDNRYDMSNINQTNVLTDIWNKANKNVEIEPLIQEAKKYKSAEEFVDKSLMKHISEEQVLPKNTNDITFYHGTNLPNYNELKVPKFESGSMTRNYGDYFYVTPDRASTEMYGRYSAGFNIPKSKILSLEEYRKLPKPKPTDEQLFKKYWAIEMPDNEFIVKDVSKVRDYTKSQLTDIWKKANKK